MSAQAPERSGRHLSIGEVLSRLRNEFPDITISKIRFLESQGLIDPERTPSGYRKFYAPDLARLRWILFQQRDHFLPLRVIKERLDAFGPNGAPASEPANGETIRSAPDAEPVTPERAAPAPDTRPAVVHRDAPLPAAPTHAPRAPAPPVARAPEPRQDAPAPAMPAAPARPEQQILETPIPAFLEPEQHDEHPEPDVPERDVREPEVEDPDESESEVQEPETPAPEVPKSDQREPAQREAERESAVAQAQARGPVRMEPPPEPAPAPVVRPEPVVLPFDDFVNKAEDDDEVLGAVTRPDDQPANDDLTRAELLEATGLSDAQLDSLEEFGIVAPVAGVGERALYDESALDIAEIAAGFHARGIEARHLKMYWHFAEREGALFAQVLVQYVRQRNPAARARMQEDLEELARLGRRLRSEMLRRALGNLLGE